MYFTKCLKITLNNTTWIVKVQYFACLIADLDPDHARLDKRNNDANVQFKDIMLVTLYSFPDQDLLTWSHSILVLCSKLGQNSLCAIDINSIQSIVAMILYGVGDKYFLVEKTGMQIAHFGEETLDGINDFMD